MPDVWIGIHCTCGQLVGGVTETSVVDGGDGTKTIKHFLRCSCGFRPYVTEDYDQNVTVEHVEKSKGWTKLD